MKKFTLSINLGLLLIVCCSTAIAEIGIVQPGIHIVKIQESIFNEDNKYKSQMNEKRIKGYIEEPSQTAQELLSMRNGYYGFSDKNEKDPYGSDLKHDLNNIKLAFKFDGLKKSIDQESILGYAVYGTYKDGWTGIATYFRQKDVGVCHYVLNNARLNESGVQLLDINVSYDVNKKPTEILVNGNNSTGYLYGIEWYDATYFHTLECANGQYDKRITDKVIALAKLIDKDIK